MSIKKADYSGKKIFVGIDVHKSTYSLNARCEGKIAGKWTSRAHPDDVINTFRNSFEGAEIHTVYEAGFSGYYLHRRFEAEGFHSMVVNPASIPVDSKKSKKTDQRDAAHMARCLANGDLESVRIPSVEREARRCVSRVRSQLRQTQTNIVRQIKALVMTQTPETCDKCMGAKYLEWVKGLKLHSTIMGCLDKFFETWAHLESQIRALNKVLDKQAKEDKSDEIIRSVPGIGPISSRVIANELGDIREFSNERKLFAYTGLVPTVYSSGDKEIKGRITRESSVYLRKIIVEVAWVAITRDKSLRGAYERIKARRGAQKAIVAIARKLIGRLRRCLIDGVLWKDLATEATT